jgi:hypothetical protein
MAIIKNELSVIQGFGTLQKVFNMKADENILHGMICELDNDGLLVKGYTGTGMAYVAQNDYDNADANPNDNSFIGNGENAQIVCIPVTAAVEIDLPSDRITGSVAAGDELVADNSTDSAGKWAKYTPGDGTIIGSVTAGEAGADGSTSEEGVCVLLEKTVRAA